MYVLYIYYRHVWECLLYMVIQGFVVIRKYCKTTNGYCE